MGKITEEEFKSISEIRQEISQIVYALGELEYQAALLEVSKEDIKIRLKASRTKEVQVFNNLKSKYGNVSINIETGEF